MIVHIGRATVILCTYGYYSFGVYMSEIAQIMGEKAAIVTFTMHFLS